MKSLRLSFLLLITLLSGIVSVAQTSKQSQPAVRWEYKTVCGNCGGPVDIDEPGDQGWELVAVAFSGENSAYERLYFKRPKPKDAPAYVRPEIRTTQPAPPPRCQLTLEQAPVIRGFRLGMSVDEILALMPESAEKLNIRAKLEKAPLPPSYGVTGFTLSRNQLLLTPANQERFAGVDHINFVVLDNRITGFNVYYLRISQIEQPNWSPETWANKIAQAFSLPDLSLWKSEGSSLRLDCSGFTVRTENSMQGIYLGDNASQKTIDQRMAAEQERLRREFKP